jgi:hypothetical protein
MNSNDNVKLPRVGTEPGRALSVQVAPKRREVGARLAVVRKGARSCCCCCPPARGRSVVSTCN